MYANIAQNVTSLPVDEKNRKSTDVICTVIGAIIALVLFILACIFFNRARLNDAYFNGVTTVNGVACNTGLVSYSDPNNEATVACVTACPNNFFASYGVCYPNDATLQAKYFANRHLTRGYDYDAFKKVLFYTAIIALGMGLLWMTLVHCAPRYAPIIAFVLAIIFLFVVGLLTLLNNNGLFAVVGWKIIVAIISFILMIILIVMLCVYSNEIKFQGIMLDYGRRFLTENPNNFLYIPLYLLFTLGLFALFVFQHCGFSSLSHSSSDFYNWANPGFWGVLNILELIWALQFLRDSFNFCVSGNAISYYWAIPSTCATTYQRLLCKHWGSVVAGSFLNAFFEIPTLFYELFICHPGTCCSSLGTTCHGICGGSSFFNLVRTDAYSYINLSGIPFCNAARCCDDDCAYSNLFVGSFSPMKHYRFVATVFLVTVTLFITSFILRYRMLNINPWHLITMLVVIYAIVAYFVNIHADAAEGIQTGYLADLRLNSEHQYLQHCISGYRRELEAVSHRENRLRDGNC